MNSREIKKYLWLLVACFFLALAYSGFIIHGTMRQGKGAEDYVAWFDLYLNGEKWATFDMPINFLHRRYDVYHVYGVPKGEYELELRWTNYQKPYKLFVRDFIYYTDQPVSK